MSFKWRKSCSVRWSKSSASSLSGLNILRIRSPTNSSKMGIRIRNGISVLSALSRAISSRTAVR